MIDGMTNGTYYVELGRLNQDIQKLDNRINFIKTFKKTLNKLFIEMRIADDNKNKLPVINQIKHLNRIEYQLSEQKKILLDEKDNFPAPCNSDDCRIQAAEDLAYSKYSTTKNRIKNTSKLICIKNRTR